MPQVVDGDRPRGRFQPLLQAPGGLEQRIHPQHEIAAQQRLLVAALLGQTKSVFESAADALLDVGRQ